MESCKKLLAITLLTLTISTQSNAMNWLLGAKHDKGKSAATATTRTHPAGSRLETNPDLREITGKVKATVLETLETMKTTAVDSNKQMIKDISIQLLQQVIEALQHLCQYAQINHQIKYLITHQICQTVIEEIVKYQQLIEEDQTDAILSLVSFETIKAKIQEWYSPDGTEKTESQIDPKKIATHIVSFNIAQIIDQTGQIITQSKEKPKAQSKQITDMIVRHLDAIVNEVGNIIATLVKDITTKVVTKKASDSINSRGSLWALSKTVSGTSTVLTLGFGGINVAQTIGDWAAGSAEEKVREYIALIIIKLNEPETKKTIVLKIAPHVSSIQEQLYHQTAPAPKKKKAKRTSDGHDKHHHQKTKRKDHPADVAHTKKKRHKKQ